MVGIAAISHIRIACDKHKQNYEEREFRQEDKIKWLQKLTCQTKNILKLL